MADKTALSQLLMSGVDAYLGRIEAHHARTVRSALGMIFDDANSAEGLHPDLFQWFYAFRDSVRANDARAIDSHVQDVVSTATVVLNSRARAAWNREHFGIPVDIKGEAERFPATLTKLVNAACEASGTRVAIHIIEEPSAAMRQTTKEAFALLRRHWPEIEHEIDQFVQRIVFFEGGPTIGAADIRYHGGIFLTCTLRSTPVSIAEEIVHESSHARLNAMLATRQLFKNDPAERFLTPLRKDCRPMFGLFHQMYVLSRLHEFFARVIGNFPEKQQSFSEVKAQLDRAIAAVRLHGILTPIGDAMVASIERSRLRSIPSC
jgi:HEXXH motif-containing protein